MKLELTPQQKKVVEEYEDSPNDSNDSQISQCPVDKSCMSLAWDNMGEVMAVTATSPESLNSSMQSMDIDEIICRVAPNLSQQPDGINDQNSPTTRANCHQVTIIPFLKRSATSIDMDALLDMQDDTSSDQSSCNDKEVKDSTREQDEKRRSESIDQLLPFNSPALHSPAPVFVFSSSMNSTHTAQCDKSPSLSNHLLSTQPCSPHSCVSENFQSPCGSMDSFKTVLEM